MSDPVEFERIERPFSAAEVEQIFGVPEQTQRDWRRRKVAPEFFRPSRKGQKFYFTLDEACTLALAKVQADAGKSVADALWVARMLTGAAILNIELTQAAVRFEGLSLEPGEKRQLIFSLNDLEPDGDYTRFLFFPTKDTLYKPFLPELNSEPGPTAYSFASLSEMEAKVTPDWVHGQIFSLTQFAFSIASKLRGEAVVTYRLIEAGE